MSLLRVPVAFEGGRQELAACAVDRQQSLLPDSHAQSSEPPPLPPLEELQAMARRHATTGREALRTLIERSYNATRRRSGGGGIRTHGRLATSPDAREWEPNKRAGR